ncbi:hypothetical protein ACPV5O_24940 [Vibrio maritimus]|jgi:hypothetical protein|uniref:hypothetical protein n=1 Tax=Vibrio maritimus TaxID=990268 RepID=UPI0040698A20
MGILIAILALSACMYFIAQQRQHNVSKPHFSEDTVAAWQSELDDHQKMEAKTAEYEYKAQQRAKNERQRDAQFHQRQRESEARRKASNSQQQYWDERREREATKAANRQHEPRAQRRTRRQ